MPGHNIKNDVNKKSEKSARGYVCRHCEWAFPKRDEMRKHCRDCRLDAEQSG